MLNLKKLLNLELEKQRLEDLPQIDFDNHFQSSQVTCELKIDIINNGNYCQIIEIKPEDDRWEYLYPKLPFDFNKFTKLEFRLPKEDKIFTCDFYKFKIHFTTILDRHKRKYSTVFCCDVKPKFSSISFTPLELIDSNDNA